jgi:hypothetical protein
MNTAPQGFFSGTNGMDASNKLPYFPAGFVGKVRVDACKGITERAGTRAFIAEVTVLESNLPNVFVNGKYSWFQRIRPGSEDTAYQACIGFLYACLGLDQNRDKAKIQTEIKPKQDQYLNNAVSEANPLAGTVVGLQTANKKMKDKVSDFTIHSWSAVTA